MARKPGRPKGFVMSHEHRVKIQNSNILRALIDHVEGTREMSSSQVSAGLGLLKKILPDICSVTLQGDGDEPIRIAFRTIYENKPSAARAKGDTSSKG